MSEFKKFRQSGFFLLEALLAILIFSLGILGMVAMNARAIQAKADAAYRTDAAKFADEIASQIALNVDRSTPTQMQNSLATFAHQPTPLPNGSGCGGGGGAPSSNTVVTDWLSRVTNATTGLPGAVDSWQQIIVTGAANFNSVTVTLCWKVPSETAFRRHTLITYVN